MSIEMPETYTYENNILRYEFLNNDFTNDLYKEFDHKATKLGLNSKINDLLSGKVVNLTENQAAFHPKYRKNNGFINEFIKSNTDFVLTIAFTISISLSPASFAKFSKSSTFCLRLRLGNLSIFSLNSLPNSYLFILLYQKLLN